jgi:predicted phosphodiesterase
MSDMHRGDGTGSDDFAHNSLIYKCALDYYLREGFTYIELGDAEELWENKSFDQIYITHTSIYDKIGEFHDPDPKKTRYIKIWGNHDIQWKDNADILREIFPGIRIYEAATLHSPSRSGKRILLWHGHQADPKCNGSGSAFSKFFVRGHTHRPVYENLSLTERRSIEIKTAAVSVGKKLKPEPVYYNTGSCVHPRCITGIEITMQGNIPKLKLVKWGYDAAPGLEEKEYTLTIKRTVLEPQ